MSAPEQHHEPGPRTATWLIRLNGCPIAEVTAPAYADPNLLAREVMLYGAPIERDGVSVRWLMGAEPRGVSTAPAEGGS